MNSYFLIISKKIIAILESMTQGGFAICLCIDLKCILAGVDRMKTPNSSKNAKKICMEIMLYS
jgi:hypothetical protein